MERCSSPSKMNFPTSKLFFQRGIGDSQHGLSDPVYSGSIPNKSVGDQLKSNIAGKSEDKEKQSGSKDMNLQKIILESIAYDWLISRITLKLTYFFPEPSIMDAIAQRVQTGIASGSAYLFVLGKADLSFTM